MKNLLFVITLGATMGLASCSKGDCYTCSLILTSTTYCESEYKPADNANMTWADYKKKAIDNSLGLCKQD